MLGARGFRQPASIGRRQVAPSNSPAAAAPPLSQQGRRGPAAAQQASSSCQVLPIACSKRKGSFCRGEQCPGLPQWTLREGAVRTAAGNALLRCSWGPDRRSVGCVELECSSCKSHLAPLAAWLSEPRRCASSSAAVGWRRLQAVGSLPLPSSSEIRHTCWWCCLHSSPHPHTQHARVCWAPLLLQVLLSGCLRWTQHSRLTLSTGCSRRCQRTRR